MLRLYCSHIKYWRNKTQLPPLIFTDVSLLFAVGSIVLLLTTELSSSYYGQTNISIDRKKLKNVANLSAVLFLIIAIIRLITIINM
jgi:hypothetical protein